MQVFAIAEQLVAKGQIEEAIHLFKVIEQDKNSDYRNEARFRHGQLLEKLKHYAEAAVQFRAVLDEKPNAQPARLELAKVLALMGHDVAARKELRLAQAGGLPPQIAQAVDQFQAALYNRKPFGGSFEVGLAPSSNINRATNGTTIVSVFGPLELSRDARAQSGVGLNVSGQAYAQLPLSPKFRLTARISTQNQIYRTPEFDDNSFAGEVGAEVALGRSRLRATIGESDRLYGGSPYSTATNASLNWQRMLGRKAQLEAEGDISMVTYQRNALENGTSFSGSLSYDRAFSSRFGGKFTLSAQRANAADPGYATTSGGASLLLYHDIGKASLFGSVGLSHLTSDAVLLLYSDRRVEWLYRANAGATFRYIKVAGFSPVVRVTYESNQSTLGIYDYRRFTGEFAITRAF